MFLKFHDHLPEELKQKYFDFKDLNYPDDVFCKDLLQQISLSYKNCEYYKDNLCSKFDFKIPDDLSINDLGKIPNRYEGAVFRVLGRLKNAQGKSCSSIINWVY